MSNIKVTVYISQELAERLTKDKSLWSERQMFEFDNYGRPPPIGVLLIEAAARDQANKMQKIK
jgi:hypothetical protein